MMMMMMVMIMIMMVIMMLMVMAMVIMMMMREMHYIGESVEEVHGGSVLYEPRYPTTLAMTMKMNNGNGND